MPPPIMATLTVFSLALAASVVCGRDAIVRCCKAASKGWACLSLWQLTR